MQRPWLLTGLLSYRTQDHLLRDYATHSGLGLATSIKTMFMGQSDGYNPSIDFCLLRWLQFVSNWQTLTRTYSSEQMKDFLIKSPGSYTPAFTINYLRSRVFGAAFALNAQQHSWANCLLAMVTHRDLLFTQRCYVRMSPFYKHWLSASTLGPSDSKRPGSVQLTSSTIHWTIQIPNTITHVY